MNENCYDICLVKEQQFRSRSNDKANKPHSDNNVCSTSEISDIPLGECEFSQSISQSNKHVLLQTDSHWQHMMELIQQHIFLGMPKRLPN
ncbi:CLUMA_CG010688, isoform A [Clunio marinus]|uniref:CLUMA_CG010688, isoform A n=1 Tax=Clunio marinus TaxID=568069 RepID=A0A1J1IAI3_9DIPT|nr:CLUMA_CG010688, isoform A [Clunio marinus]